MEYRIENRVKCPNCAGNGLVASEVITDTETTITVHNEYCHVCDGVGKVSKSKADEYVNEMTDTILRLIAKGELF